ncbi:MAG: hypothetical protein JXR05_09220 [Flavobacteriaceae bacterium]
MEYALNISQIIANVIVIFGILSLIFEYRHKKKQVIINDKEKFLFGTEKYIELQKSILESDYLHELNLSFYFDGNEFPEKDISLRKKKSSEIAFSGIIFQLIEDIYLLHDLEKEYDSNKAKGWMSLFRMWMSSSVILEKWNFMKKHFTPELIVFVETHLIKEAKI